MLRIARFGNPPALQGVARLQLEQGGVEITKSTELTLQQMQDGLEKAAGVW